VQAFSRNRDSVPEPTGAAGRGLRAHRNLIENLVPYAAVVLTAQALCVSTPVTVIASLVFLAARIIHALSYLAGITGIRTLAYNAGLLATLAIVVGLVVR
jgi:uncharacterized MAPEG superfamily protein